GSHVRTVQLRARPTKSESYLTRFGKERGSRIPLTAFVPLCLCAVALAVLGTVVTRRGPTVQAASQAENESYLNGFYDKAPVGTARKFDWRYRVSERGAGQVTTAPWLTTASDRT